MPTTDELKIQVDALTARVNAIDGIGLSAPAVGAIPTINNNIAGLRTTIKQSVLQMQQLYTDLKDSIDNYIVLFKSKFGIY